MTLGKQSCANRASAARRMAQFAVPKFSSARVWWMFVSSKTIDFIYFSAVLSVGIPQAKWNLSDNLNH